MFRKVCKTESVKLEAVNHGFGQRYGGVRFGKFIAGYPEGLGQFIFITYDCRISVNSGHESEKYVAVESPGLRTAVSEILYFKTDFLHGFTAGGLFRSFTYFAESGDEGKAPVRSVFVSRHQNAVSVSDSHDYGRSYFRVDDVSAVRAGKGSFLGGMNRFMSAPAAEAVACIPAVEVVCGKTSKAGDARIVGSQHGIALPGEAVKTQSAGIACKEIVCSAVYGEKIEQKAFIEQAGFRQFP